MDINKFLCPDVEALGAAFKLKNLYAHKIERTAVSYEIIACNPAYSENCASPNDIKAILDSLFFTQYFVMEGIDFQN